MTPKRGETGPREVTATIEGEGLKDLVEVTVGGGTVTATDGHPFWVTGDGAWVDAEDLQLGDRLLLDDGTTTAVASLSEHTRPETVYNLTVEGIHTYYINTGAAHVLVHNCSAPSGRSPSSIRFSQSSVNNVDEIARSMRGTGWVGDPIDVVRMPDGSLATLDNTRVLAAHQAGIDVQAIVRAFDDPLTTEMAERFAMARGGVPATWGEAITNRIGNQNAGYRTAWPDGSPFTGWSGN